MDYTDKQTKYNELNTSTQGARIIPTLKERILCAVSYYLQLVDLLFKEKEPETVLGNEGKPIENAFKAKPYSNFFACLTYYDELLNAGVYGIAQVKNKLKALDAVNWSDLPHYYDDVDIEVKPKKVTKAVWDKVRALTNPIISDTHFKDPKKTDVKITCVRPQSIKLVDCAWLMIYALSEFGVYINAGHHMSSINQIFSIMTLHRRRFKETWYQESGSHLVKNPESKDKGDTSKHRKFNNYGLDRTFYHHFRMLNYSKETKARLRRMTGVGTDIIDYINVVRSGRDTFNEKDRIRGSLKRKLGFWKNSNTVDDYLNYLNTNVNNEANLAQINSTFLGVVNMMMPTVDYKIVLPAYYWFWLPDHKKYGDFSAQGAYEGYVWLRQKLNGNGYYYYEESAENLTYAFLLAVFDLHQADQNLLAYMFKGINPKTRSSFAPTLEAGVNFKKLNLPELVHWSKMYKGERGGQGEEQASVVQVHAGTTSYSGDDFVITKPEEIKYYEVQTGGMQIVAKLQAELRKQYNGRHNKIVSYGTQKWYSAVDVAKSNEELAGVEGEIFKVTKVIPFYSSSVPAVSSNTTTTYEPGKKKRKV